jgi:abhydrolase domain-containing protein 6
MRYRRVFLVVLLVLLAAGVTVYFAFPGVVLALAQRAELRAAGLERRSIDVAGNHIEYLVGGSGEPMVLLHGFGGDKSAWVRVSRYLTPHFRIVAPDIPGFGESSQDPSAHYGIVEQVERIHAFVHALGLGTVHLGGNSMGGAIAGVYAARHPEDLRSLWLLDPGWIRSAKPSELQQRMAQGDNPLLVTDVAGFERLLDFVFFERPSIPRPIERYLAEQAIVHRPFNEKIMGDFQATPVILEDEVKGVPTPTLITWGDHDRLVDVSGAQVLKSVMPYAEVVVMPNVGHVPMVEKPEAAARAFLKFRKIEQTS